MSYLFDGSNNELYANYGSVKGALASNYAFPLSIALWFKAPAIVAAVQYMAQLAYSNSSNSSSVYGGVYRTSTDEFRAVTVDSAAASISRTLTFTLGSINDTWTPVVLVFGGSGNTCNSRQLYYGPSATASSTNVTSSSFSGNLGYFFMGEAATGGGDLGAANPNEYRLAHAAIWNSALNSTQAAEFCAGNYPGTIGSSLIAYWPLVSDTSQAAGSDAVGALVSEAGSADGDNPDVDSGVSAARLARFYQMLRTA